MQIQTYYDWKYDGIYRLIVMDEFANVLKKASITATQKYTIVLFHHCHHFDLLIKPGLFFKAKYNSEKNWNKYCYDCEQFYIDIYKHRGDCPGRRFILSINK